MKKKHLSQLLCSLMLSLYLLGVHDGKIALWQGDDPEPVKVFPYSVSMLPKEAQERLEAGIPINSMAELRKLAQAYLP